MMEDAQKNAKQAGIRDDGLGGCPSGPKFPA
jgi:hypothetical protein